MHIVKFWTGRKMLTTMDASRGCFAYRAHTLIELGLRLSRSRSLFLFIIKHCKGMRLEKSMVEAYHSRSSSGSSQKPMKFPSAGGSSQGAHEKCLQTDSWQNHRIAVKFPIQKNFSTILWVILTIAGSFVMGCRKESGTDRAPSLMLSSHESDPRMADNITHHTADIPAIKGTRM